MTEKGLYYAKPAFFQLIRDLGGQWNDHKHRPLVCLVHSTENPDLYWAIPMGKLDHRTDEQRERLNRYLSYPTSDLRSCYYHVGRTTARSIFFITDAVPIIDKYIDTPHLGNDKKPYLIKNPNLVRDLNYKLLRILHFESQSRNYFRQHISDIKDYLLNELANGK